MPRDPEKATSKPDLGIILASSSPRRKELLGQLISEFEIISAEVNERKSHQDGPLALVKENAKLKAWEVAKKFPDRWVLGADTMVILDNFQLGKPKNLHDAKAMLRLLSGKTHQVCTGIFLTHIFNKVEKWEVVSSTVTFRQLDEPTIEEYLSVVDPLDKAGGYAIQTKSEWIIKSFAGSYSNIVGLPLERLSDWLRECGPPYLK